jgi:flagellar protein FlbD
LIKVTRLNNTEFWLNPHMIEIIEKNPDTTITLNSGKLLIVKESPEELFNKIVIYRRKLGQFGNEK